MEVLGRCQQQNAMVPLATVNTRTFCLFAVVVPGSGRDHQGAPDQDRIHRFQLGTGRINTIKDTDILSKVTVEDIHKFGMIPEFIGRLPIICTLQGLSKDMLVKILKEPKNAILKQYQKLLELDEVKLEFTDDALDAIAEKAMKRDTGARALRSIIEDFMLDSM